ncbi:adenylate/guanylate cyclase domain-containing protein [Nocardioides kongjuensis]|uniref:Class 3 adenylate cyclase n=1 Tax=Nocardioides kongjuensis TaxID=349522 RepID=A0A852RSZ0_9ACTN|nr:class 3 adenylate cyclase [Nocardioides kongjuensis]
MGVKVLSGWLQERHALHMGRWMLEFDQPDAEREFRAYDDAAGLRQARIAVWVAVFFVVVYGGVDFLVVGSGDAEAAAVIRFAIATPALLVAAVLVRRAAFVARHLQLCAVVLVGFIMVLLGTVLARTADLPATYVHTSGTVTLIGAIGLLRMRMHATGAAVAIYAAVSLTLPRGTDQLETIVAPTIGLSTIAVIVGYALERLRRTAFERQRAVELERARSEELLFNVLPVPIAQRLRTEPGAIADSAPSVSVLFSDIVGFTPVSEALPAEELVGLLDTMFREFDALCDLRGIEKIKTVGDAYMAVAGLPVPDENHAASLAELALDMQRTLTRLSPSWPSPIAMRIGIASGPVVAGVIGQRKFTYDLWGDTVNTASRMESHGRAHRIQVSEATHALLEDRYMFSDPQVVDVKGKGLMTTYFLLGAPA